MLPRNLSFFFFLLVATPVLAQSQELPPLRVGDDTFQRRLLANGLHAAAIQQESETATIFLAVGVGNRNETAATTGLAHLTEHAMFAGTPTTGTDVHEKTVVAWGGEANAYTRDDFTMYYDHEFPPEKLAQVLAMDADRLRNLSFEESAVLHERHRLELEEAHSYHSADGRAEELEAAVFPLHPYGLGLRTKEGHTRAPGLSVDIIRSFYNKHYHPNRVAVVVVGPMAPEQALDAIEQAFAPLERGPEADVISLEPIPNRPRQVVLRSTLPRDRKLKVWLTPVYGQAPRPALEVLTSLLQRAKLSTGEVLTVAIGGRVDRDMLQVGWSGGEATDHEVENLLQSFRDGSVFDEESMLLELEEVKQLLVDGYNKQPLRARPYFAKAATFAGYESLGLGEAYADWGKEVSQVDAADVVEAAHEWLAPQHCVTVVFRGTGEKVPPLPDDVEGLQEAAAQAAETGNYERAIEAYTMMLAKNPNRMNTVIDYAERGQLYLEMSDFDHAIADFEAALKVVDYPAVRDMLEDAYARKARALRGDFSD